ncbi:hypothetical protein QTP70_022549 [Hemibagrus guttatus]|uniref:Sodium/bile acid cotransporter 4 n=1 Tax=Hemibagrus guttatus TaxID=175788 RepID=A0AAE0QAK5_9TELE|nr:hypothetical protein QTP70_022549 [Hemibagrus guttatus]
MLNCSSDPAAAAILHVPENAMNAPEVPGVALASWSASEEPALPARAVVAFWDSPLSHGMNVFVGFILCFTMLGLGCTVEVSQMGEQRAPAGRGATRGHLPVRHHAACGFPAGARLLSGRRGRPWRVLLCGCCPGGNLSNLMTLLINGEMNLSVIMTISSTVLALLLMPLCLWLYSPCVDRHPGGAAAAPGRGHSHRVQHTHPHRTRGRAQVPVPRALLTSCSRHFFLLMLYLLILFVPQVSLWLMLITLVLLFIMTGVMLGPELLATIPPAVYVVAVLMPMAGYAAGYGLAMVFSLPPNSCRTVSLETGCQNVQLCTAILKLTFPPQLMGAMYMFPLLYALFQAAEATIIILVYRAYRTEVLRKQDLNGEDDDDTNITYKRMKEEEDGPFDTEYGSVTVNNPNSIELETQGGAGSPTPL